MKSKIKRQESIVKWSSYELDGKLDEVIVKLQGLMKDNPNHFDFQIDVETESGYYGSCSTYINVTANRWETDQEFENRLIVEKETAALKRMQDKQKAEANEKRERSLYESLKRKFESEIEETGKMITKSQ